MDKLTAMLEKYLLPIAGKLSDNKYLQSITDGLSTLLPVTMIGAIFTLLTNLQIDAYQTFITNTHLKEVFSFAPKVTTDLIAVYSVFLIGKALASKLGEDDKSSTIVGVLALFSFLVLIPLGVSATATESKEVVSIAGAIPTTYLGSAGLFSAMIVGMVVAKLYTILAKGKLVIKMPDGVPPTISKSFSALIPSFIIGFVFCGIRYLFSLTSYGSANGFIYQMLQKPLTGLGASPITFILFIMLCSLLWFFGLHGGMIIMPFLNMLYQAPGLENLAAYEAGGVGEHIIIQGSWSNFASLGGAGGTLGLCILMVFVSKSSRYKTLGRIALPSGICGINEPITFGAPVVLNTMLLIPFVITPIITFLISYIVMSIGLVNPLYGVGIPLGTPLIFSGLIAGGWKVALLQALLVVVQMVIYLPFFKVLDNQAVKEEKEEKEA